MNAVVVRPIRHLDFTVAPWAWPFAHERAAEIAANFAARRAALDERIWNGRVLLLSRHEFVGDTLRGTFFETDFADFLAWRDWGCPDAGVVNAFSLAALRASDGAFLLGVMGAHTANAGHSYFPCGTPDPHDIVAGGRVDLAASVLRELAEETGLDADDVSAADGWQATIAGPRIALMRILDVGAPADAVREKILGRVARMRNPELADIRIVRSPSDYDASIPNFVTGFLDTQWR